MIRKLFLSLILLPVGLTVSFAQVYNNTNVYVRPTTSIYVDGAFNTASGSTFTMDEQALLYVRGDLNNNGTMTFENDASLLRGEGTPDGGSGTFLVRRQGTTALGYNYWGTPVVTSGTVPGNPSYMYKENLSTQDPLDDNNPNPDPGWELFNGDMIPGDGYAGWSAGLVTFSDDAVNNGDVNAPMNDQHDFASPTVPGAAGTPFNLVGNPYPSGLDCWKLIEANPDVFGSLYFWVDDMTQGSGYNAADYAIWNYLGSVPNTSANNSPIPNGHIKTGQGFLIRNKDHSPNPVVNGDNSVGQAVLHFKNAQRIANTASDPFFKTNADESKLWFSLNGNGVEFFSQILVAAVEDATHGEDRLYDAIRLPANTGVSLSAVNEQRKYGILAFPPPAIEETVPLSVFIGQTGTFTFKADEMIGFQGLNVFLNDIDPVHGSSTLLSEGTTVSVTLTSGLYEDRFYLNFTPNLTVGIDENEGLSMSVWAFADQLNVQVNRELEGPSSLDLFDMSGRLILTEAKLNFSNNRASVPMKDISAGDYVVRVVGQKEVLSQKFFKR